MRSTGRHEAALEDIFARVESAFSAIAEDYDDDQLNLISGFVSRLNATAYDVTSALVRDLGEGRRDRDDPDPVQPVP
ncbi:hypothetical protein [Microtetraspora sp. NBRC 16547]|uniref:hypothetical protein n=1 Tax=Microtetraspora sp. NBRC 16547 TaxID=3030993 RepID=UPI0024A44792|nr:hypothetical protein [Microtetraspora sp. NBRC 16547]GLX02343.1 hypothetical protein Misp02_64290 [Microtetraspora sp. NBRC 16547]